MSSFTKKSIIRFPAGNYKDAVTGEDKTRWMTCGVILVRADGTEVIKMDAWPVDSKGWLSIFPAETTENRPQPDRNRPAASPEQRPARPNPTPATQERGFRDTLPADEDIPF